MSEWISVKDRLPNFGQRVIWRGVLKWRTASNQVAFFDDQLTGDIEPLEYGGSGYCLREHDYLAVPHDTDYCDEIVTHWTEIPSLDKQ